MALLLLNCWLFLMTDIDDDAEPITLSGDFTSYTNGLEFIDCVINW